MADKKSVKLLPEYLQSDKNAKFLSSTIDQFIQSPELERIDGYVGSTNTPNYNSSTDFYLPENFPLRQKYQLEPALVFKDSLSNITDVIGYDDLINELSIQGAHTNNLDRLFRTKFYSYNPHIDWDKLVNHTQYYWLPNGPDAITIDDSINVNSVIVGQESYTMSNGYDLTNGLKLFFTDNVSPAGYRNKEYIVEGVGKSIKLIEYSTLEVAGSLAAVYNESYDNTAFDSYPFDSDKKLALTPEYITINRASKDLNPWSRYNRWFHAEVIRISAEINGVIPNYDLTARAQRPIVEFRPNIQLYKFGNIGIPNVDLIDTTTKDAFGTVDGAAGYYVDEIQIQAGNRVIFNADENPDVRGKIYLVSVDSSGQYPVLRLNEDTVPNDLDSVSVNYGVEYAGKSWYYDTDAGLWNLSQQHETLNEFPLFDLFDADGLSFSRTGIINNFTGNEIFGYDVGTGTNDSVLGFPLKYQNSIGVGSYLFKNYFMTGSIVSTVDYQSKAIPTGTTFLKINEGTGTFVNVWAETENYPISTDTSPLGLTNNPLNGPITDMTLSELSDHVSTMISRDANFNGVFPGISNLRDIVDYEKYGTRLIINENPIAFAKIFLGKKEHNAVDAIRKVADHYNQFKLNLIKHLVNVDSTLAPSAALDTILLFVNLHKDEKSSYYRSDMLGYGNNKVERNYTVSSLTSIGYPIGVAFNLSALNFKSVLVYKNNEQLTYGIDYTFDFIDESVILSSSSVAIGDKIKIVYYPDTLGAYVPPTPSKLGLYPKFEPKIYLDDSYLEGPVTLIQGHDGSVVRAYGDYRDDIILEFEKRIYNNIKIEYKVSLFDVNAVLPGAFRTSYSDNEIYQLLQKDFLRWAGVYNVDTATNTIYEEGNGFTWNYKNSIARVLVGLSYVEYEVTGSWRSIYKYFFDTDRPHSHPWEMLGFAQKPDWWEAEYGPAPYLPSNSMWTDLEAGLNVNTGKILESYVRPGLTSIIPVDGTGSLKSPDQFLVIASGYADKKSNWQLGDVGPAEASWRRSSYWPFAVNALSALLHPVDYASTMYDLSRTARNSLNQLTYLEDDLYLNPSKLLIDGENNVQTSGFGNFIVEVGSSKDNAYRSHLRQDLEYINFNLFYKLGGFTSKDKLQIIIDSIDPVSAGQGAILPQEDYSLILNVSNPIKAASISGIIVQKTNGKFVIKGYDKTNPYFEILKPVKIASSGSITVGGKSSPFTEWSGVSNNGNTGLGSVDLTSASSTTTRYYKQGQVVRYNNKYYRVKVSHTAQPTFDLTYFQVLSGLPTTGGATVALPSRYETSVTEIPYGSEFETVQEVYDVVVGYGAYLESQGFIFDRYNTDLNEMVNWKFAAKEFLYWSTQNWADNNLITLSPFAEQLKYQFTDSIVDSLVSGKYEYSLLKADGKSFPIDKFNINRDDGVCTIETINTEEGIFFATLNLVQKEHGLVFNNSTIFNDTIYDIETGYRQRRVKLSGFRTANWNGDIYSPGFIYDSVNVSDWQSYGIYLPGKVVRYNGAYYEAKSKINGDQKFDFTKWVKLSDKPVPDLLTNFDYKIKQFEDFYSLDIDNFDTAQQDLSQHLVGYTERTYLNDIFTNPISQYKFYTGFIREKGTKNALDKITKAGRYLGQGNIELNEEWAFRVGHYGGFPTYKEIEFPLDEGTSLENPYLIKFIDTLPNNIDPLVNYTSSTNLLLKPDGYLSTTTFEVVPGTFLENGLELVTAGYVRPDDATFTAYNKNSLLDIANNALLKESDIVWLGFLENGDWTVYRYSKQNAKVAGVFVSAPGEEITFVTDRHHNLMPGDVISIVRFNEQVNGVYIVKSVPKLNQITVASELSNITNAELLAYGALFKFDEVRYSNLEELSKVDDLLNLTEGEKVWIDEDENSKWAVYEKTKNYATGINYGTRDLPAGQRLGIRIHTSQNSPILMASAPAWSAPTTPSFGRMWVYQVTDENLEKIFEYSLNSTTRQYAQANTATSFGYSSVYDVGKELYFVGAHEASNVKAPLTTGTVVYSTGLGTAKSFVSEGLLKISRQDKRFASEKTERVLVSPYATTTADANYSWFGRSIFINQVPSNQPTLLLVGAPGDGRYYTGVGGVYAYNVTTATNTTTVTLTAHPNGLKLQSSVSLNAKAQWGARMAGNKSGTILAVVAPGYVSNDKRGLVEIFKNTGNVITSSQVLFNPFNSSEIFGDSLAISSTGKYLVIASKNSKLAGQSPGKLAVYELVNDLYQLKQVLNNPVNSNDLNFGHSVSLSEDEKTLVVSALGVNRSKLIKFDTTISETVFDGGTTRFTAPIKDAGTVYVYNNLGGWFVQADELNDAEIKEGSRYGASVVATNNSVYVGSPSYVSSGLSAINFSSTLSQTVSIYENVYIQFSAPDSFPGTRPVVKPVFGNITTSTKDVIGLEIVSPGSGYKRTPTATLEDSCGTILDTLVVTLAPDDSCFYQFKKIDRTKGSWNLSRYQDDTTDVNKVKRLALIDSVNEEIIEYLDIFDPVKGKIPGVANQELKYRSASDPATYSLGIGSTINDSSTSWIDDHVGELWWDLSTAKYVWYEQGDDIHRKNNWGKLFPGATIDVYEWVKSDLLPSEWAAQADTSSGLTKGISGQPKYPDNSVVSVKQIFNSVTNAFENVYYFWVKNKVTVPDVKNRRISSYEVANLIADPAANGLKFAEILSPASMALANVQPMLDGDKINLNIVTDTINNEIPRHTEWLLLEEGNPNNPPSALLEKKLIDSLLGHDPFGNLVPSQELTSRNRYGIGIRPQQSLFKDRIEAIRTLVEFTNSVLINHRITGNYSFENLNKFESIPAISSGEYDYIVDDLIELEGIDPSLFVQATVQCFVQNGKIRSVNVTNPGYGYANAPKIIVKNSNIEIDLKTEIDNFGRVTNVIIDNPGEGFVTAPELEVRAHSVIVRSSPEFFGRWSQHGYDYLNNLWIKIKTQSYNTPLYWDYADWSATNFNQYKDYSYVIDSVYQLATISDIYPGEYVKINNVGDGRFVILEKTNVGVMGNFIPAYDIVFSENGTIQILDSLWDYVTTKLSYDDATLEETLYDEIPDQELFYILTALKEDIFVRDLKVNWNLFFFKAVRYAMTEQKLLDWAFKTSFVNVTNELGSLDQRAVYKLDNEEAFEKYIKEIKPYHTKIRNYTSKYNSFDTSSVYVTDFDLPSYFNTASQSFVTVNIGDAILDSYPYKSWADNYKYELIGVEVNNPGGGYTQQPTVVISTATGDTGYGAAAEAYIRNGELYKVIVTDSGSGYVVPPIITIIGGGNVVTTATVRPVLGNSTVRKNILGIKFDRVSTEQEILEEYVTEEITCPGSTEKIVLSWLADPDKLTITPLLDGQLVFAADYKLEYYSEFFNGYDKKFCRFVFLREVPAQGQVLKITYKKNINLYTAVDRIQTMYDPTDEMPGKELPLLMSGAEYPGTVVQGLGFDYSPGWGLGKYNGESAWSDLINYYATARLSSTATVGDTVLTLSTTTDIIPGQVVNILNSSTIRIRPDTVVESVNTSLNQITISAPNYNIWKIKADGTTVGSTITVKTLEKFYGDIKVGDIMIIEDIASGGFDDTYLVSGILSNDTFTVTATNSLSTTTGAVIGTSVARVSSILTTVPTNDLLIRSINDASIGTSTFSIALGDLLSAIGSIEVLMDGLVPPTGDPNGAHPGAEYYHITETESSAIVTFYNLGLSNIYDFEINVYAKPLLEFWKLDTDVTGLDSAISGGSWTGSNFMGALGVAPEELIIDGNSFINIDSGYAPEECVAGTVIDSVGINVFTRAYQSYALAVTGGFGVREGETTSHTIGYPIEEAAGILVHFNNQILNRVTEVATTATGPYFSPLDANLSGIEGTIIDALPGEDTYYGSFELGFDWNMYGTSYSEIYVGANGYVTFGGGDSEETPILIDALENPAIFAMYCNLWQSEGVVGQPLDSGQTPGLFTSSGTLGNFNFWRLRFTGTHYDNRADSPTMPTLSFELTLYSNGTDQYVEIVYGNTWQSLSLSGDDGFVMGVSDIGGQDAIQVPYNSIADNSSHVFYSSANDGNWLYAGQGKVDPFKPPYSFTATNQFFIAGDQLIIAPQETNGRGGYTMIGVGGDSLIDSVMEFVTDDSTEAALYSLAYVEDVRRAYVLADGKELPEITTSTSTTYGYMIEPISDTNRRTAIRVYNIPSGPHTLQAWLFNTPYDNFNRLNEEVFVTTSTQTEFVLSMPPGGIEPSSAQAIVEVGIPGSQYTRRRINPPWVSYYQIENSQTTFDIDSRNVRSTGTSSVYTIDNVKVYGNGVPLSPGFDFTIDNNANQITLVSGVLTNGDVVAVSALVDYDYVINNNILEIPAGVSSSTVRVVTFTDHDHLMMRTERFNGSLTRRFTLSRPALTDNWVWVYVDGKPITARYDYEILSDLKTIQISEWVDMLPTSDVLITTIDQPYQGDLTVGYKFFKDMFGRHHYKRIADYYSTTLAQGLNFYDTEIHVTDASRIIPPNPAKNRPGVIMVDGERIEFFSKNGNVLGNLRRATLGTGPADYSDIGTKVIDMSPQQTIPYSDVVLTQTTVTNSTTYIISTVTDTVIGDGITISNIADAVDQVSVYYGGRLLRKKPLTVHRKERSYDTTSSVYYDGAVVPSYEILPPEFTITTSTQELVLNIENVTENAEIRIVKVEATVWTGTESLLTSDSVQAQFLRARPTELPDSYFYGGEIMLVEENNLPLTNDEGDPLEGY